MAAEDGSWGAADSVTAVTVIWKPALSEVFNQINVLKQGSARRGVAQGRMRFLSKQKDFQRISMKTIGFLAKVYEIFTE